MVFRLSVCVRAFISRLILKEARQVNQVPHRDIASPATIRDPPETAARFALSTRWQYFELPFFFAFKHPACLSSRARVQNQFRASLR